MGIPSHIEKIDIFISKEQMQELSNELQDCLKFNGVETKKDAELSDLFNPFNIIPVFNSDGDIIAIEQEAEKLYYIEDMLDTITPFVKSGSSLQIRTSGECGLHMYVIKKWFFKNGKATVTTVYEDI